jgi:hypothetical protein
MLTLGIGGFFNYYLITGFCYYLTIGFDTYWTTGFVYYFGGCGLLTGFGPPPNNKSSISF